MAASWLISLALSLPACAALDGRDGPDRMGRIALSQGPVSLSRAGPGPGEPALPPGAQLEVDTQRDGLTDGLRNWPLAPGDRLRTGPNAIAELGIGTTRWRLGERSELWVLRLDDERILLRLAKGSLAWAVIDPAAAAEIEVSTGHGSALPLGSGVFRVQADAARWSAASWQGVLRLEQPGGTLTLQPGQAADGDGQGGWRLTGIDRLPMPDADDRAEFDWMRGIDLAAERARLQGQPGSDVGNYTGREDLGAYGTWNSSPQWGTVWYPSGVAAGWSPYQDGRWVWGGASGWIWVDPAPWGFATSHYGRWVRTGEGRWGWVPGPRVIPRPPAPQPMRPGGPPPAWGSPSPSPWPPRGTQPMPPPATPGAPAPPPNVTGPRPPWTQPGPNDRRPHERVQPPSTAPAPPAPPAQEEDRRMRIPTPVRPPLQPPPPAAVPSPAQPVPAPAPQVQPPPRPPEGGGFMRRVMPPPPAPAAPAAVPAPPAPAAPRREERRVEHPGPPERPIPGRAQ